MKRKKGNRMKEKEMSQETARRHELRKERKRERRK